MPPIVNVIGYTNFFGVPYSLLPINGDAQVKSRGQDTGSMLARIIECAGRTCYDSYGIGRNSQEYHKHIKEVGHGSVLEHASINFYLDNISRGCTHELVRHRAGCAISQRSTRYVDEEDSPWALHPLITKYISETGDKHTSDWVDLHIDRASKGYASIVRNIEQWLTDKGIDKLTARKQARGAARGMLGNALCTSMVWTANIRALRNAIEQRASPHADAEIRVLFNAIYEECMKYCPEYFDDYEKTECPDGIGYGLTTKYRKV